MTDNAGWSNSRDIIPFFAGLLASMRMTCKPVGRCLTCDICTINLFQQPHDDAYLKRPGGLSPGVPSDFIDIRWAFCEIGHTADPFRLKERALCDHFTRGDRQGAHVHHHVQEFGRTH